MPAEIALSSSASLVKTLWQPIMACSAVNPLTAWIKRAHSPLTGSLNGASRDDHEDSLSLLASQLTTWPPSFFASWINRMPLTENSSSSSLNKISISCKL